MPDDQKWRLSTGKVIEDALFKFGMRCNEEQFILKDLSLCHISLCHSFILNPDDAVYINDGIFTKTELEEIRSHNRRELPDMPDDLLKHMMTFAKVIVNLRDGLPVSGTIQELRKQLQQPIDAIGDNFIREIHHDLDWLQYAMYTL
ncbi:hypothetical protein BC936DRAFT_146630 [Jimgerdemannia flammicorona]|uniref:Uncharacterized protein n=1 Tax=Jimgerdemannia flammicorona TaxID=994334 RepID=A0A433D7T8_9FUNG|nr:hypothetical protein BC936DRAFT_146630 [Jimgerdemannia flammicorona]